MPSGNWRRLGFRPAAHRLTGDALLLWSGIVFAAVAPLVLPLPMVRFGTLLHVHLGPLVLWLMLALLLRQQGPAALLRGTA